ncbi:hypothetical protein YC2023_100215 [Brassica napus]
MSRRSRIKDKQQRNEKSKISRRFCYRENENDGSSFSPPRSDSDERRFSGVTLYDVIRRKRRTDRSPNLPKTTKKNSYENGEFFRRGTRGDSKTRDFPTWTMTWRPVREANSLLYIKIRAGSPYWRDKNLKTI